MSKRGLTYNPMPKTKDKGKNKAVKDGYFTYSNSSEPKADVVFIPLDEYKNSYNLVRP